MLVKLEFSTYKPIRLFIVIISLKSKVILSKYNTKLLIQESMFFLSIISLPAYHISHKFVNILYKGADSEVIDSGVYASTIYTSLHHCSLVKGPLFGSYQVFQSRSQYISIDHHCHKPFNKSTCV
jgi:hypothetical protein